MIYVMMKKCQVDDQWWGKRDDMENRGNGYLTCGLISCKWCTFQDLNHERDYLPTKKKKTIKGTIRQQRKKERKKGQEIREFWICWRSHKHTSMGRAAATY